MESLLDTLHATLQSVNRQLNGPLKHELLASIHDHDRGKLPNASIASKSKEIVNLMGELEKVLEPSTVILADHFLDLLMGGPRTVLELADDSHAKPLRLRQVLRILHNNGIFEYDQHEDTYRHNHTSELLTTSHWTQWRNWVDLYGNNFYDMARGIPSSLSCGQTRMASQINYDTDLDMFSYFASQNWVAQLHKTLGGGATAQAPGILEDYPWHELSEATVLDIGGGEGALLALVLSAHPNMLGALLDTERVISHAKPLFHEVGGKYNNVARQMPQENFIVGNFLEKIPSYSIYTMKWCLHDWDDSQTAKILKNIREAIIPGPDSRLIIFESILADGRANRLSRYADVTMMVSANGEERTEQQWRDLAGKSGWEVARIFELRGAWPQAIELRCADSMLPSESDLSIIL